MDVLKMGTYSYSLTYLQVVFLDQRVSIANAQYIECLEVFSSHFSFPLNEHWDCRSSYNKD